MKSGICGKGKAVAVGMRVGLGLGVIVGDGLAVTKDSTRVGGVVGLGLTWFSLVQALNSSMNKLIHAKTTFRIIVLFA